MKKIEERRVGKTLMSGTAVDRRQPLHAERQPSVITTRPLPMRQRAGPQQTLRGEKQRSRHGFTLIEILVVIVVIAILASLVAPNVFRHVGTAKDATARTQIEMLGAALDAYRLDNGRYPTTEQGLAALWQQPTSEPRPTNWRGPYLRKDVPLDPWNHVYVYKQPAEQSRTSYDLMSLGADGQPGGTADDADITSWK